MPPNEAEKVKEELFSFIDTKVSEQIAELTANMSTNANVDHRIEYKLHILDKNNYIIWKRHMKNVLAAKNLLDIVEDPKVKDEVRERQVSALLTSALSADNQMKVINCSTANKIWRRLEAIFENKSSFEKENLLNKLHSYKIKSGSGIPQAISEMESLAAKLELLGERTTEDSLMSAILRALPASFKTFITVWKGTAKAERTIDNLLTRLMAEVEDTEIAGEKALFGGKMPGRFRGPRQGGKSQGRKKQFPGNKKASGGNPSKDSTCHYCKLPGHFKRDCRKFKQEQGEQSQQNNRGPNKQGNNPGQHSSSSPGFKSLVANKGQVTTWIADSGASVHLSPAIEIMEDYEEFVTPVAIGLGNQEQMFALGTGNIITNYGIIEKVHYVPEASNNLYSESTAANRGVFNLTENGKKTFIDKDWNKIFEANLCSGLYVINFEVHPTSEKGMKAATLDEWHRRFAHVNQKRIKKMADTEAVEGLNILKPVEEGDCTECAVGKSHRTPHSSRSKNQVNKPAISLHFDTVGPIKDESMGGAHYAVLCKDEYSGFRIIKFVESKSQIPEEVKLCISKAELETGNRTLRIVSDNGTEFVNDRLTKYLRDKGINHELSVAYTPQQNGLIERDIRTVFEAGRTMLIESKLPKFLWAEAMNTAVYVLNRTINSKSSITPYELWYGSKPDVSNLHAFGSRAITLVPENQRSKLDPKGEEMIFIGYTDRFNTFRFFDPRKECLEIRCDVMFLQSPQLELSNHNQEANSGDGINNTPSVKDITAKAAPPVPPRRGKSLTPVKERNEPAPQYLMLEAAKPEEPNYDSIEELNYADDSSRMDIDEIVPDTSGIGKQKRESISFYVNVDDYKESVPKQLRIAGKLPQIQPTKLRKQTNRPDYRDRPNLHAKLSTLEAEDDPNSYKEAMARSDKAEWKKAMDDEIASLQKNDVWDLVERPEGNIVTNRWVLKIKRKPNGEIDRYRARLVARGFTQIYGIDYNETYAPVVNATSIRLLFAFASISKLVFGQFDVKTAFLYGNLDETIFMEQPEGYVQNGNLVCRLKKSLYGLKQAPRMWNREFTNFLTEMKLKVSAYDECILYRFNPLIIVAIYVDDGIVFAENKATIDEVLNRLRKRFDIHSVEESTYLGFQIERNEYGDITLHQDSYINKILKKFNMDQAKPKEAPIAVTQAKPDDTPLDASMPYREAIGSLMYGAVITRIDISYAVGKASRLVASPTVDAWNSVKQIFRYLVGKSKLALTYSDRTNMGLEAYCDADFAGDLETYKSTTGEVILFGGAPIHWRSQRQTLVTLSSTEAEVVSMCTTVKDLIWIRNLARELGMIGDEPTPVYCDNQSALRIVSSHKSTHRTRHIGAQTAYTLEQIENKQITVHHVRTDVQVADMLTKSTSVKQYVKNRNWLMSMISILSILLVGMADAQTANFDRVTPIIWSKTGKYVDQGLVSYLIDLRYINPCSALNRLPINLVRNKRQAQMFPAPVANYQPVNNDPYQNSVPNNLKPNNLQNQGKAMPDGMTIAQDTRKDMPNMFGLSLEEDYHNALRESVAMCNQIYSEDISGPIAALNGARRPFQDRPAVMGVVPSDRRKRSVIDFAIGAFISNVVSTIADKIWSSGNEAELKERSHLLEERLKRLVEEMNVTEVIEKAHGESLRSMGEIIRHTQRRLATFVNNFPHLVFTTNYFTMNMMKKSAVIERLQYAAKHQRLDLIALSELTHSDWLNDIEESSTNIIRLWSPNANHLQLRFQGRRRDPFTQVYRVNPFRYWANLTESPTLMEYAGERYLIYNYSSNCILAIDEPSNAYVSAVCSTRDYVDKRLAVWNKVLVTKDPFSQPANTTWKGGFPYVYIYCYRLNITMRGRTRKCPPDVFRLNGTIRWNTTDHEYIPEVGVFAKTVEITEFTHDVHTAHFAENEHIIDDNKALEKIIKLNGDLEQLHRANLAVELPIAGGGISYASALRYVIIFMVVFTISIICMLLHKDKRDTRRHRRVLETVTDGIYGTGTYSTARHTERSRSSSRFSDILASVKGATSNVGPPTQINLTMNSQPTQQQLPPLPAERRQSSSRNA